MHKILIFNIKYFRLLTNTSTKTLIKEKTSVKVN